MPKKEITFIATIDGGNFDAEEVKFKLVVPLGERDNAIALMRMQGVRLEVTVRRIQGNLPGMDAEPE